MIGREAVSACRYVTPSLVPSTGVQWHSLWRVIGVFGSLAGREEIEELAPSVLDGWMGAGPKVREFEEAFSARLGVPFVMTNSGSSALHLAVAALDLPPGSEVIVPSFTWVACAHAVVLAGHRPVFCDVDLDTQNIDAAAVEPALSDRSAAIMVVHYAGRPARVDELEGFGLPILEDAAHAVDSMLGGRRCGTLGRVGVFSFDSVKNLATPDGGGLCSPDPELVERARALRYCGLSGTGFERSGEAARWWEPDLAAVFPRTTPNDVSASIGLVQLRRLDRPQERRRQIWERLQEGLAGLDWLVLPGEAAADERHSWFTYLVRVAGGRRDALARHLLERGIYSTLRYHPLHLSALFGDQPRLPNCERLGEEALNLPLHPRLSDSEVDQVIDAVRGFRWRSAGS
jgi:dTDP-4-amino-4,6-dideoxygalactose transaminase